MCVLLRNGVLQQTAFGKHGKDKSKEKENDSLRVSVDVYVRQKELRDGLKAAFCNETARPCSFRMVARGTPHTIREQNSRKQEITNIRHQPRSSKHVSIIICCLASVGIDVFHLVFAANKAITQLSNSGQNKRIYLSKKHDIPRCNKPPLSKLIG